MIENRHPLPAHTLGAAREIVSNHYGARGNALRATVTPLVSEHGGRLFARQLQRFATAGETIAKVAGRAAYRSGDLLSA